MTGNQRFDSRHHTHRHTTIDRSHDRHRPMTQKVTSRLHDYKRQNKITINTNSSDRTGPSLSPLIHPSTEMSNSPTINIEPEKDHLQYFEQREQFSKHKTENQESLSKVE